MIEVSTPANKRYENKLEDLEKDSVNLAHGTARTMNDQKLDLLETLPMTNEAEVVSFANGTARTMNDKKENQHSEMQPSNDAFEMSFNDGTARTMNEK